MACEPVALPDPRPREREVDLDFSREWVEFFDPGDPEHLVRADLTWLLSRWACIFGAGCYGVNQARPAEGCCTHGAFFTDGDDEQRVRRAVRRLDRDTWQHYRRGFSQWTEMDTIDGENPARRTALRDETGPCIFHNDPDFPGGYGCALHAQALRDGVHPMTYKPDVCWQLPVRRDQEWVTRPDETEVLVTTLSEFDRRGWGSGGHDHHWWCTGAPEGHQGSQPLYLSYETELTALIGEDGYTRLAELCAARLAHGQLAEHPATVAGRAQAAERAERAQDRQRAEPAQEGQHAADQGSNL